jgi:glutathione S-transferase
LALEHVGQSYELEVLSKDHGDLDAPGFRRLNPHGKLPVLVDDAFVLYESAVITDYVEDVYSTPQTSLWPTTARERALARCVAAEAPSYIYPHVRWLVTQWAGKAREAVDQAALESCKRAIAEQLAIMAPRFKKGFAASDRPGAADYALYPLAALLKRLDNRQPGEQLTALIPPALIDWAIRVEALPYFANTYPPHWRT